MKPALIWDHKALNYNEFVSLINDIPNFKQELNDNIEKLMEQINTMSNFKDALQKNLHEWLDSQ